MIHYLDDIGYSTILLTMQAVLLILTTMIISILCLDAFLPEQRPVRSPRAAVSSSRSFVLYDRPINGDGLLNNPEDDKTTRSSKKATTAAATNHTPLTHADIVWKLRPPPETSIWKRIWLRFAANLIRLDCIVFRKQPPIVLCPKGGQAVVEGYCYTDDDTDRVQKVGRFGITTERGPSIPLIQETVHDIYGISPDILVGVGAIIYMFVEPKHRKLNIGSLALEVISLIHAIQGIDFTVLVVDDDGSGKLIDWYTKHGFTKAPKLQEVFGSPNAINGITMIAPTNRILPQDCQIQWW